MKGHRSKLLDVHKEKVKYFEELQKSLPKKQKQLIELRATLKTNPPNRVVLEKTIDKLKRDIESIKNRDEETEYYANTAGIISEYLKRGTKKTVVKKCVDEEEGEEEADDDIPRPVTKSKKSGITWDDFMLDDNASKPSKNNSIKTSEKSLDNSNKVSLHDQYMDVLGLGANNNQGTKKKRTIKSLLEICSRCGCELVDDNQDGFPVCNQCGLVCENRIVSYEKTYKEQQESDSVSELVYKRTNHFRQWLAQFQAKDCNKIKSEEMVLIIRELRKNRITTIDKIDPVKIRAILKKLGMPHYFHHIPWLVSKISRVPAPKLTLKEEKKMLLMFDELQVPYEKYKLPDRHNFMSYSYTLHKFCELLELDHLLPCFPLLKSKDKLKSCDMVWKKCCKHLGWQYIPSDYT